RADTSRRAAPGAGGPAGQARRRRLLQVRGQEAHAECACLRAARRQRETAARRRRRAAHACVRERGRALPGRGRAPLSGGGRPRCGPRSWFPPISWWAVPLRRRERRGAAEFAAPASECARRTLHSGRLPARWEALLPMKTGNYFSDNADLVRSFDALVAWDRLVPLTEGAEADVADAVSTWREVLSLAGRYIGTEIASRAKSVDEIGIVRQNGTVDINEPLKQNV